MQFNIAAETISRSKMKCLIAEATEPLVFEDCIFEGEDLSRLDMRGFEFKNCTFIKTSFYAADMSETIWLGCRGRQADFEAAELVDAQFQACDLNNTKWRSAKLSSASYRGCKSTGANFEEVTSLGLSCEDTLFVGADLRMMSFHKMELRKLDFSDADLSGCDFRNTVFLGGSLRNAHLESARFEGADLREADIGVLRLVDTHLFRGAIISHRQAGELLLELGLCVI